MQQLITFISTENKIFCDFLAFPLISIEYSLFIYYLKNIFNFSLNKSNFIKTILLSTVIGSIIKIFLPLPFNLIINFIIITSLCAFILKIPFFETIIGNSIFIGLEAVAEYIINLFASKLFNFNLLQSAYIPTHKIFFSLLVYLFIFICIFIVKLFKTNIKFSDCINAKEKLNIFILVFSTLLLICPNLVFLILTNMQIPTFYIIYNTISAIIFFFLGTYSTYKLNRLQITTRELDTANLYNSTLSKLVDSNRAFRHDIANIINAIGGYIELNDISGLKKYYETGLLPEIKKSNNLSLLNPDVINSPPLFGLFLAKYNYADTLGVKIELNSFFDYSTININIFDFVKIFGILLDNAIEAASKCDEKLVSIHITIDFYNRKQIFKIINTYLDKQIDTKQIFEKDFSTKKIKSGFGLWEVKQLLKKYPKAKLLTSKDNIYFSQKLEIPF